MLNLVIFIIEDSDLVVGAATYCEKFDLARFRLKEEDGEFVSSEEMARELGDNYIPPCSQLTYEADWRAAKQRILESRYPESIK